MFRITTFTAVLMAASIAISSAQTPAPKKMSPARLKELKANWSKNKPKMTECRKQVKAKGLAGDDRWFFMEECMGKS